MSDEKQTHDEVDAILEDLFGTSAPTEAPADSESPAAKAPVTEAPSSPAQPPESSRDPAYVSFEEDGEDDVKVADDLGSTRVVGSEGGVPASSDDNGATRMIDTSVPHTPLSDDEEDEEEPASRRRKSKNSEALGCLKAIIYIFVVLTLSVVLAMFIFKAFTDVTGIGRSSTSVNIEVPAGASTQMIAQMLAEEDVIEEPLIFRLYCRLVGADGTFHSGVHIVSSNMGYDGIVDALQTLEQSETVTVMIEEGATVDRIATILEANDVCTAGEFYAALVTGDYEDYDFIAEITEEQRRDRIYLLEGYLFPDTYEFYVNSEPEAAIRTMLDNFDERVDADTRASIRASGKTVDEVIIAASIVQKEAGFAEDMPRVMRVIVNRLQSPDAFPRLQMDSTAEYLLSGSAEALDTAYNTYVREGLPVGAICNPGLDAIHAALNPSEEPEIIHCFYFASIVATGETQFFETFEEHEAWCIEHGVGMYG